MSECWQGYGKDEIYGAQDECLIAISEGKPLLTNLLQRIPPERAVLLANIAERAGNGTGLEQGTYDQLKAEAEVVGPLGELKEWWKRE